MERDGFISTPSVSAFTSVQKRGRRRSLFHKDRLIAGDVGWTGVG